MLVFALQFRIEGLHHQNVTYLQTAPAPKIHRCIVDLPSNEAFLRRDLHLERAREELHAAEADHS
jgi:hypothetical protein